MFGFTRSGLVDRLSKLRFRFEVIEVRAKSRMENCELGSEMGFPLGESYATASEIFVKSGEQAKTCFDAILLLTVERAPPGIFRSATKRAEKFATQCEAILNEIDYAEAVGRKAAQSVLGISR